MATDRELAKRKKAGEYATLGMADPLDQAGKQDEESFVLFGIADASFAELPLHMRKKGKVKACVITSATTLATHGTDYITTTLAKRDGAGGGATTIATHTTNSSGGSALTAMTPRAATVTASAVEFDADNVLTLKIVESGTPTTPVVSVVITVEYT